MWHIRAKFDIALKAIKPPPQNVFLSCNYCGKIICPTSDEKDKDSEKETKIHRTKDQNENRSNKFKVCISKYLYIYIYIWYQSKLSYLKINSLKSYVIQF